MSSCQPTTGEALYALSDIVGTLVVVVAFLIGVGLRGGVGEANWGCLTW